MAKRRQKQKPWKQSTGVGNWSDEPVEEASRSRKVSEYDLLWGAAEKEQITWVPAWKDVRDYLLPHRGLFTGETANDGGNRASEIIDATATIAHRIMIGGLKGGLTSSARPWFKLGIQGDPDLSRWGPVRVWLDETGKRMTSIFKSSNFYSSIDPVYEEESGFGQGVWIIDEDDSKHVGFYPQTCGTYMISSSRRDGLVDTLYRRVCITVAGVVERFGKERLPGKYLPMLDKNPYEFIDVRHCIRPNHHREWGKIGPADLPYESVYWIEGEKEFLRIGGYYEFPAPSPRWDIGVGAYSRGPGRLALGAIKMLQEMEISILEGTQRGVDPPVLVPTGTFKNQLNRDPGSETQMDPKFIEKVRTLYDSNIDLASAAAKEEDVRIRIREIFFNDLFLMLQDRTPKTAYEVAQLQSEKLRLLGPVVEQQFFQLLDPTINRVFSIMARRGLLPEWPKEIEDVDVGVEYISLMAQAQKLAGVDSINAHIGFVGNLAQMQIGAGQAPDALDKVDFDAVIDEHAEATGAPAIITRSQDAVDKIRAERQQAVARQMQAQQDAQDVELAKQASEVKLGENTALDQLRANLERAA